MHIIFNVVDIMRLSAQAQGVIRDSLNEASFFMTSAEDLARFRVEIDAIDTHMHQLLLTRASVVAQIEAAKGLRVGISAYRPAREAQMMRHLMARHAGPFPYAGAEHIWREIIGNFTRLQSPYAVHIGSNAPEMRDLAHFQFGALTPISAYDTAQAALASAQSQPIDMALISLADAAQPWWVGFGIDEGQWRIVAAAPLVLAEKAFPPAVIMARVPLEPSGDDLTIYTTQQADLVPNGMVLGASSGHFMVARAGYHVAETLPHAKCIGAYAAPFHAPQ